MSDELAIRPDARLGSVEMFELSQREAKLFIASSFAPEHLRGKFADCVTVVDIARRLGRTPRYVAENIHFIHGKAGFSATFIIGLINRSRKFSQDLDFEMTGEKGRDSWGCRAWSISQKTGQKIVGPEVTVEIAKAEGWWSRPKSKWPTMTEAMLQYRAATQFARLRCPDILDEVYSIEEFEDMKPASARVVTKPNFEENE